MVRLWHCAMADRVMAATKGLAWPFDLRRVVERRKRGGERGEQLAELRWRAPCGAFVSRAPCGFDLFVGSWRALA